MHPTRGFRLLEQDLLRIFPQAAASAVPQALHEGQSFRALSRTRTILILRDDRVTYRLCKSKFRGAEVVKTVSLETFLRLIS